MPPDLGDVALVLALRTVELLALLNLANVEQDPFHCHVAS